MTALTEYLHDIEIQQYPASATQQVSSLPFHLMEPLMFESFCLDLLDSHLNYRLGQDIFSVQSIGRTGQKQNGADVFVKEYRDGEDRYSLYEVKRVQNFGVYYYKKTLNRFLDNYDSWGFPISKFTILVADNLDAKVLAFHEAQKRELSARGIKLDLIQATDINKLVKSYPELVYKYFHPAWTEAFWGEDGLWHLKKYGVYRFEESPYWVNYKGPKTDIYGDSLSHINDHVVIKAFVPSFENDSLSCYIEFRNGKFSYVMITLNPKQLLERYFVGAKLPMDAFNHPFILKDKDRYIVDIGNCRISLSKEEVECLLEALNVFSDEYQRRVALIEHTWKSHYFPSGEKGTDSIPLLQIKRGLWNAIKSFACANDAFKTQGEWSIFDSGSEWLKVYTSKPSADMEVGYHVMVIPTRRDGIYVNYSYVDDDVVLAWQTPNDHFHPSDKIGPRYYWDAKTTHDWLANKLIPTVVVWLQRQEHKDKSLLSKVLSLIKNNSESVDTDYNPDNYLVSFYKGHLLEDVAHSDSLNDLKKVVNALQYFFHMSKRFFIDATLCSELYYMLYKVMLHTKTNDFSYLHSNINYINAEDYDSLKTAVLEHSKDIVEGTSNGFMLDYVMRCFQACLDEEESHLNSAEVEQLINGFIPFIILMEHSNRLERAVKRYC